MGLAVASRGSLLRLTVISEFYLKSSTAFLIFFSFGILFFLASILGSRGLFIEPSIRIRLLGIFTLATITTENHKQDKNLAFSRSAPAAERQ